MTIYNTLAGSLHTGVRTKLTATNRRRSLMFIGDSITWGFGVTQDNTYAKLLQGFIDLNATNVDGVPNTDEWTARSVHLDDITGPDPANPTISRDTVAFKLIQDGTPTYAQLGSFVGGPTPASAATSPSPGSTNNVSVDISSRGTAIMLDAVSDGITVVPSAPTRFLVVVVEVLGAGSDTVEFTAYDNLFPSSPARGPITVTVNQSDPALGAGSPAGVYRLIFDWGAGNTAAAFLVRRTGGSVGPTCRVLAVNPTNRYGTSNYLHVQVHARGSYRPSDYMNAVAEISKTIINPVNDTTATTDPTAFVLALGTVSMYYNAAPSNTKGDRRQTPTELANDLRTLVNNLRAAHPSSPIIMTHPPVAAAPWILAPQFIRQDYDSAIQATAIRLGCPLIDLRGTLVSTDYGDGIHPNNSGHTKLANAYRAALRI